MAEMTALGAAMLAGLAVGVWPSLESIELNTSNDRFAPRMTADGAPATGPVRHEDRQFTHARLAPAVRCAGVTAGRSRRADCWMGKGRAVLAADGIAEPQLDSASDASEMRFMYRVRCDKLVDFPNPSLGCSSLSRCPPRFAPSALDPRLRGGGGVSRPIGRGHRRIGIGRRRGDVCHPAIRVDVRV